MRGSSRSRARGEQRSLAVRNVLGLDCYPNFVAPCQHFCARTPFDKNHALWSSWTIQGLDEAGRTKGSVRLLLDVKINSLARSGLVETLVRSNHSYPKCS